MISVIILVLFNALFIGITTFWGAWYSLTGANKDSRSTLMPIILAIPRFFMVILSVVAGMFFLGWSNSQGVLFTSLLFGSWILITTAEIFYIQTKLRNKSYETKKVEEIKSEPVQVSHRTRSNSALISYEARKMLQSG